MLCREFARPDPVAVAGCLSELPHLAFLDSSMRDEKLGRYSYVAADPFGSFTVQDGKPFWNESPLDGHPLDALRLLLRQYPGETDAGLPPFQGGCAGFFGYDFGRNLERLARPDAGTLIGDEACFHFYDVVIAFDHVLDKAWIISGGWPGRDLPARKNRAEKRLQQFVTLIEGAVRGSERAADMQEEVRWTSNFTRQTYCAAVQRVKDYILAGDIFQANLSQRFEAILPDGFDNRAFYRQLRVVNPAPFSAYLDFGDYALASSSPERFISLQHGMVEARPIKGTAKRSDDPALDRQAAEELLASEKDRAENVMIVDLLRNDISRVCRPGSVKVPMLCGLESYESVHHLVSVVIGQMQDRFDALDLIAATFPGGSITGAPKIRAMDIIGELEMQGRGAYCGAIGYIGFDGNMDMNIAIRTISLEKGRAIFQVGGGITLLSDPEAEYDETLLKASRIFQAFRPVPGTAPDVAQP